MRKAIFIGFVVLGAAAGMVAALDEGWGLKAVFACVGGVVGASVGGALSGVGRRQGRPRAHDEDRGGLRTVQDQQEANYWLDRGRPTAAPGLPHADDTDSHSLEP